MKAYPVQVLFREYFEGILAAIFLALFLRFFVVSILYIPTDSMEPNLKRGDFVIGWRLSYGFPLPLMKGERLNPKNPDAGDIVSFRFPGDEEQLIIRRVVGVPGDRIEILEGKVKINGKLVVQETVAGQAGVYERIPGVEDAYHVYSSERGQMPLMEVPEGTVFVLSDNRKRTDDSRDWGLVPVGNIESRLGLIWLSVNNQEEGLNIVWPRMFKTLK